jgi:hypothetical protein
VAERVFFLEDLFFNDDSFLCVDEVDNPPPGVNTALSGLTSLAEAFCQFDTYLVGIGPWVVGTYGLDFFGHGVLLIYASRP